VSLICCSRTEREKAHPDTTGRVSAGKTGSSPGCGVRWRTGS
jgi:hypothetical protein